MTIYVALIADYTGRYLHVHGTASTWPNFADQLEDLGCEVIENQSDDYEGCLPEEYEESGAIPVGKLLTHTDFVPHL
jgi:hypothetical protein